MAPLKRQKYENGHITSFQNAKKLADAGVKVNLGAMANPRPWGSIGSFWMFISSGNDKYGKLKAANYKWCII